jgi:hypothetical protein
MADFPVPGGSCLVSYRIDDFDSQHNLIGHGYVRELHLGVATIESHLCQMYQNGQRRLGICIPYFRGGDTSALDSTDGKLTTQDRANLTQLLQTADRLGFREYLVEMIPEWSASYANWQAPAVMGQGNVRAFQPLNYAEDFAFTIAIDTLMASTGLVYHMDLIGEGADIEVCARFWSDWCDQKGGVGNAVGFSMVPTQQSIDDIPRIYTNGLLPPCWNVHAYNGSTEMTWSQFKTAMKQAGHQEGFVVGETNCNDPATAQAFQQDSGDLFWILQWPVVSGVTPPKVTQDRLTLEYSAYQAAGL